MTVEVYNLSGQEVFKKHYKRCVPYLKYGVNLQKRDRGLHVIRFRFDRDIVTTKIMVE